MAKLENTVGPLADDFTDANLPYPKTNFEKAYSTVLRFSSPGVTVWLHYDVNDNMLCQVRGRKRVVVFPPSCVEKLRIPCGESSSEIDARYWWV